MNYFSEKHIAAAISDLPNKSSEAIATLRGRAEKQALPLLKSACDTELASRPFAFTQENAHSFSQMSADVRDMDFMPATHHAFTRAVPAKSEEIQIIRSIASNPGMSFDELYRVYGKGDLSLVIGHLVYHRYGCFRKFMITGEDQSSVILTKTRSIDGVRYWLKSQVEYVFHDIGII